MGFDHGRRLRGQSGYLWSSGDRPRFGCQFGRLTLHPVTSEMTFAVAVLRGLLPPDHHPRTHANSACSTRLAILSCMASLLAKNPPRLARRRPRMAGLVLVNPAGAASLTGTPEKGDCGPKYFSSSRHFGPSQGCQAVWRSDCVSRSGVRGATTFRPGNGRRCNRFARKPLACRYRPL